MVCLHGWCNPGCTLLDIRWTSDCVSGDPRLTDWIDILRGVKQGCPLSPLLFIIAYDPLLFKLRLDKGLKAFAFSDDLKLDKDLEAFAFADDLALFGDSITAISPALSLINLFSIVSGLGVNSPPFLLPAPIVGLPFAFNSPTALGRTSPLRRPVPI